MADRKIVYAPYGGIATNGEIYGSIIFLEEGMSDSNFRFIPREEYERIMAEKAKEGGIRDAI